MKVMLDRDILVLFLQRMKANMAEAPFARNLDPKVLGVKNIWPGLREWVGHAMDGAAKATLSSVEDALGKLPSVQLKTLTWSQAFFEGDVWPRWTAVTPFGELVISAEELAISSHRDVPEAWLKEKQEAAEADYRSRVMACFQAA